MPAKTPWTRTIFVAFLAFVGIGLTSGLLGVAWPSMQKQFALPLDGVNTLFLVTTGAYTLASFYIGRLMARFGSGMVLLVGAIIMVLCTFAMAGAGAWLVIVAASLIFGFGNGLIDAGLNLYVAAYHTAQQMNLLHASFGIGITIGPLIMTFALDRKLGWQAGYIIVASLLLILVALLVITRRSWRTEGFTTTDNKPTRPVRIVETLRIPVVWFGMLTFLAYVGTELGFGQWSYTILTESRHIPENVAGPWVSLYWGSFTVGRILWSFIANRFDIEKVLRGCMIGAFIGAALFFWQPTVEIGLLGLLVLGFAQAPVFPMLMAGTASRVGAEHAANTVSLQMTAVGIGSAVLPGLLGTLGKNFGLETMAATFVVTCAIVFIFHELTIAGHRAHNESVVPQE